MLTVESVIEQAKQYDNTFQSSLPGYKALRGTALNAYGSTIETTQGVIVFVD